MLNTTKSALAAAIALATLALGSPEASAAEWRLIPSRCPDLVEDRRDRRVNWSRADLREDARDARRTICPASAFVYTPRRGAGPTPAWRDDAVVVFARNGRYVVQDLHGRTLNVRIRVQ